MPRNIRLDTEDTQELRRAHYAAARSQNEARRLEIDLTVLRNAILEKYDAFGGEFDRTYAHIVLDEAPKPEVKQSRRKK